MPAQGSLVTSNTTALAVATSYEEINPLYTSSKGYLCCTLPDRLSSMWLALTFAGAFGWAVMLGAFIILGRIDKLPRSDLCGFTAHTYKRYNEAFTNTHPAAVLPFEVPDAVLPPFRARGDLVRPEKHSPPPSRESRGSGSRGSATMVHVTVLGPDGRPLRNAKLMNYAYDA